MTNLTIDSPIDIASGCSMRVSFHILGYVALGLLINLIFSVALIPDITGMLKAEVVASGKDVVSGAKDAVSGGKDAIGSAIPRGVTDVVRDPAGWVVAKVIPVVLFALCAIGFLAAYFLLGKRAGVACALSYVIDRNKRYLIDRVLGGFASYFSARMGEPRSNTMTYAQAFEAYKRSLSNQPIVLRWMCWAFVKKFNLDSAVAELLRDIDPEGVSSQDYWRSLADKVSDKLDIEMFAPSYVSLAVIVGLNLSVGFALKLYA